MLTFLWSIELAYSHPAALSVLHRFQYLPVLSNEQNQFLSKGSLPNVHGVDYLSLPCPQPGVLRPSVLPSESLNPFTRSWLKTASPAGLVPHPVIRIFVSLARDYVSRFAFGF